MALARWATWLTVGTLACGEGGPAHTGGGSGAVPAPPARLGSVDFQTYARGTATEIRLLRRALGSGRPPDPGTADSAAAAAGVSVDRFREISAGVENALRAGALPDTGYTTEAQLLDSLRIELRVLRLKADVSPRW
jgi:hypothetical protein